MRESDNIKAFCAAFETKLRGSAPDIGIDPVDPDVCWEKLKTALHESAVASFWIKRPLREDWMAANAESLEPLILSKNDAHRAHVNRLTHSTLSNPKEARGQLQKATRQFANKYWNNLCDEIQTAADSGKLREMYRGLRKATGPSARKVCPLKSTTGELITDSTKQLERWVEHYSVLYGKPRNITERATNSTPIFDTLIELDNTPTMSELVEALKHTDAGKAPGTDEIPANLLKCNSSFLPYLYNLLCICWCTGKFAAAMKDAKIITLFKKGDKGDCNNYRGISLLSVTGKVFARVLLPRLQQIASRIYPESQCGFRSGRSTVDMIFSVRHIQEKCTEQRQPLHTAFVDLTKAFDMVSRHGLFAVLQKLGCPPTLLSLTRSLHYNMSAVVSFDGSMSDNFPIRCGVKQGCVLAPTLFGIFLSVLLQYAFNTHEDEDSVYLHTRSDGKLFNLAHLRAKTKVRTILVLELLFADDAALVSYSAEGLQRLLDKFSAACAEFTLVISTKKSVVLHQGIATPITVNDQELGTVDSFAYLGSIMNNQLSIEQEIQVRIGRAASTFNCLRDRAWLNKHLTFRKNVGSTTAVY